MKCFNVISCLHMLSVMRKMNHNHKKDGKSGKVDSYVSINS